MNRVKYYDLSREERVKRKYLFKNLKKRFTSRRKNFKDKLNQIGESNKGRKYLKRNHIEEGNTKGKSKKKLKPKQKTISYDFEGSCDETQNNFLLELAKTKEEMILVLKLRLAQ